MQEGVPSENDHLRRRIPGGLKGIMRYWRLIAIIIACVGSTTTRLPAPGHAESDRLPSPKSGLDAHVQSYDSTGRSLVECVLGLAYDYHFPMGLEYVDRNAVRQHLAVRMHGATVRDVLTALVSRLPEYRVGLSGGVVHLYSPKARDDPSNLMNTVISDFEVNEVDTRQADFKLFVALARKLGKQQAVVGSIAVGAWGSKKITLHLRGARVHEILDAIVAANGVAVWTVRAPAEKLSVLDGTRWYIYPLELPWKEIVSRELQALYPAAEEAGK